MESIWTLIKPIDRRKRRACDQCLRLVLTRLILVWYLKLWGSKNESAQQRSTTFSCVTKYVIAHKNYTKDFKDFKEKEQNKFHNVLK